MTNRIARHAALWLWLVCVAPCALASEARAQPAPPLLTAPVSDVANVIDDGSEREMERRIRALQAASGDVVVVATVPTFKPYADIEEYAVKMFENGGQGIGEKGKDNGLLIVLAVEDRRIKIEVGYALEEFITDGFAGETIRDEMTPQFRNGNYGAGLLAGSTRIINRIAEGRGVTHRTSPADDRSPIHRERFPRVDPHSDRHRDPQQPPPAGRRLWGGGPWSGWNSGMVPSAAAAGSAVASEDSAVGGGGGGRIWRLRRRPQRRRRRLRRLVV